MVCMSPSSGYRKPAPADSLTARIGMVKPDEFEMGERNQGAYAELTCRGTLQFWVVTETVLCLSNADCLEIR
jgi:hypothetical protein